MQARDALSSGEGKMRYWMVKRTQALTYDRRGEIVVSKRAVVYNNCVVIIRNEEDVTYNALFSVS